MVIDVTVVDGGVAAWPELIAALPAAEYAEIGAVLFFDQGSIGPPEARRRRWRIVVNPRVGLPVPEPPLTAFEVLDARVLPHVILLPDASSAVLPSWGPGSCVLGSVLHFTSSTRERLPARSAGRSSGCGSGNRSAAQDRSAALAVTSCVSPFISEINR